MHYFHFALQAEEQGDFLPAIAYYEQSIAHQEGHLEAFLNVAFLYWVVAYDEGFQAHFLHTHGLGQEAVFSYHTHWRRVLASAREQLRWSS